MKKNIIKGLGCFALALLLIVVGGAASSFSDLISSNAAVTPDLVASPPVCTFPPGAGVCTVGFSWISNSSEACVYFVGSGGTRVPFSCPHTTAGSASANWIGSSPATFELRSSGVNTSPILDTVTVWGQPGTATTDPTPTLRMGKARGTAQPTTWFSTPNNELKVVAGSGDSVWIQVTNAAPGKSVTYKFNNGDPTFTNGVRNQTQQAVFGTTNTVGTFIYGPMPDLVGSGIPSTWPKRPNYENWVMVGNSAWSNKASIEVLAPPTSTGAPVQSTAPGSDPTPTLKIAKSSTNAQPSLSAFVPSLNNEVFATAGGANTLWFQVSGGKPNSPIDFDFNNGTPVTDFGVHEFHWEDYTTTDGSGQRIIGPFTSASGIDPTWPTRPNYENWARVGNSAWSSAVRYEIKSGTGPIISPTPSPDLNLPIILEVGKSFENEIPVNYIDSPNNELKFRKGNGDTIWLRVSTIQNANVTIKFNNGNPANNFPEIGIGNSGEAGVVTAGPWPDMNGVPNVENWYVRPDYEVWAKVNGVLSNKVKIQILDYLPPTLPDADCNVQRQLPVTPRRTPRPDQKCPAGLPAGTLGPYNPVTGRYAYKTTANNGCVLDTPYVDGLTTTSGMHFNQGYIMAVPGEAIGDLATWLHDKNVPVYYDCSGWITIPESYDLDQIPSCFVNQRMVKTGPNPNRSTDIETWKTRRFQGNSTIGQSGGGGARNAEGSRTQAVWQQGKNLGNGNRPGYFLPVAGSDAALVFNGKSTVLNSNIDTNTAGYWWPSVSYPPQYINTMPMKWLVQGSPLFDGGPTPNMGISIPHRCESTPNHYWTDRPSPAPRPTSSPFPSPSPITTTPFKVGDVIQTNRALNIWTDAGSVAPQLGTAPNDAIGTITEGYKKIGIRFWWKVTFTDGKIGWISEGNGTGVYYIEIYVQGASPLPSVSSAPQPTSSSLPNTTPSPSPSPSPSAPPSPSPSPWFEIGDTVEVIGRVDAFSKSDQNAIQSLGPIEINTTGVVIAGPTTEMGTITGRTWWKIDFNDIFTTIIGWVSQASLNGTPYLKLVIPVTPGPSPSVSPSPTPSPSPSPKFKLNDIVEVTVPQVSVLSDVPNGISVGTILQGIRGVVQNDPKRSNNGLNYWRINWGNGAVIGWTQDTTTAGGTVPTYLLVGTLTSPLPSTPPVGGSFAVGDTVEVLASNGLAIRVAPGVGSNPRGLAEFHDRGEVKGGPSRSVPDDGYDWYEILYFESGTQGWSREADSSGPLLRKVDVLNESPSPSPIPAFQFGDTIKVKTSVAVRVAPGTASGQVGFGGVPVNTEGKVLEGPVPNGNFIWYRIEYYVDGRTGWSAERRIDPLSIYLEKIDTSTQTPIPSPSPSFIVDDLIRVKSAIGVNVRVSPSVGAAPVGTGGAPQGTEGRVLLGPTIADGYTWYRIEFSSISKTGWSAEKLNSAPTDLFLEKANSSGQSPLPSASVAPSSPPNASVPPTASTAPTASFQVNDTVRTKESITVRVDANVLSQQIGFGGVPTGTQGKVLDGPVPNGNYIWYRIEYLNERTGWSAERKLEPLRIYLEKI